MTEPIYYVNGEYMPASQAALGLNDLGIVRGYGVFDLLRTYDGKPFKLYEHVLRLQRSAAQIKLTLPWTAAEIEQIALETYARNAIANATIRIVATGGASEDFMTPPAQPTLVVMINEIAPTPLEQYTKGVKVITTQIDRIMPTVKSLNYITAIIAMQAARPAGAVEAIYRTGDDRLTEGTRANFFVFQGNRLITPKTDVLGGITREVVLEIAEDDFEVVEAPLYYADLATYDEAFITSSTKEVLPVVQIDDITIGQGRPGPNTQKLIELFRTYVSRTAK
ncbi:MAG: aminotransferase class IV [Chloroflexi bacterium]|nr:aminotransferase class IV [Chloroflexota bacterium]